MPAALKKPRVMAMAPWQWIGALASLAIAIVLARVLTWLVLALGTRLTKRTTNQLDDHLVNGARGPLRLLLTVFAFRIAAPFLSLGASAWGTIARALSTATVIGFAWLAIRLMRGGADWLDERSSISEREYKSRGLRTQIAVLYRVASIAVFVIALAAMLAAVRGRSKHRHEPPRIGRASRASRSASPRRSRSARSSRASRSRSRSPSASATRSSSTRSKASSRRSTSRTSSFVSPTIAG